MDLLTDGAWLAPLLIFCARLTDVSLGTFRIVLISRGTRGWAAVIGFVESIVWLMAIGQAVQHLDRPLSYVAYAGGFAAGTWLGVTIERKVAMGLVAVRIITREDATELIDELGAQQFGVTSLGARGLHGRVRLIFTIVKRKEMGRLLELVRAREPKAFISVSDVRAAEEGFLPRPSRPGLWGMMAKRK